MGPEEERIISINCTQCSTALPDGATFCWRCGYVRRTATDSSDAIAYEACEIVYGPSSSTDKLVFWARATGDSGAYAVAESEPLKRDETGTYLVGKASRAVLDHLLADLLGQGWEPLGTHGIYFWEHRLRRPVAAEAAGSG